MVAATRAQADALRHANTEHGQAVTAQRGAGMVDLDSFLERVAAPVENGNTVEEAVALEFRATVPTGFLMAERHLDMFRAALVRLAHTPPVD